MSLSKHESARKFRVQNSFTYKSGDILAAQSMLMSRVYKTFIAYQPPIITFRRGWSSHRGDSSYHIEEDRHINMDLVG